jgi:pimeloyl-ACP methyl ester carboxylesterase
MWVQEPTLEFTSFQVSLEAWTRSAPAASVDAPKVPSQNYAMADLPLVCLHGLGRGPSDWDGVRPRLEAHGRTSAPALPRRPASALAVAARAIPPDAVVVGHSMGGIVALRVAAGAPGRLRGIVLTGCPFPPARNGRTRLATAVDFAAHRVRFLRSLPSRPPSPEAGRRFPPGLSGFARMVAVPGKFDALCAGLTTPVLVVHARDDHHVPVDFALAAAARSGWDVRLLEAGGHHAHIRTPDAWAAAVEPWIDALEPSG